MKTEDFASAGSRHYEDGLLLRQQERLCNADQLFGFAAECAIKSALVGLQGCTQEGVLASRFREHVDRLWDLARLHDIQRRLPKLAALLRGLPQSFDDWSVDQRYAPDEAISEDALERHSTAARRVLGSVGLLGRRGRTSR